MTCYEFLKFKMLPDLTGLFFFYLLISIIYILTTVLKTIMIMYYCCIIYLDNLFLKCQEYKKKISSGFLMDNFCESNQFFLFLQIIQIKSCVIKKNPYYCVNVLAGFVLTRISWTSLPIFRHTFPTNFFKKYLQLQICFSLYKPLE